MPRRGISTVVVALVLFAAPNVLGLLAGVFPRLLRRFSLWWPPAGLELMPMAVTGVVLLVVAYLLATRQAAARKAAQGVGGEGKRRRFLPPLELLLLQIGNLSFLAFAAILVVVALGYLSSGLRAVVSYPPLVANSLAVSVAVAVTLMLLTSRSRDRWARSRIGVARSWARRCAVTAIAVAGFGLVGASGGRGLLRIRFAESQIEVQGLAIFYGACILCLGVGWTLASAGQSRAAAADLPGARRWLTAAVVLASTASLGMLALYLNGAFLTVRAHLVGG